MYIEHHYPFPVLPLPYPLNGLEPCIHYQNLCLHHGTLYRKYVEKLNFLLCKYPAFHSWNLEELIFHQNKLPESIRADIVHNAGGVFNHQIFFQSLGKGHPNVGYPLQQAIVNTYGSFASFTKEFYQAAVKFKGSGYLWLVCNEKGNLSIVPTNNQETTIPFNLYPLIGIDLYEHAYYPQYLSDRELYISNAIQLINWDYANGEYILCLKQAKLSET